MWDAQRPEIQSLGLLRIQYTSLEHAMTIMEQDAYKNADLLVVSDFIMAGLSMELLADIERQRLVGNRFHSLVVGGGYMTQRLKHIFDNEWIFEPGTSQIHELVHFEQNMKASRLFREDR